MASKISSFGKPFVLACVLAQSTTASLAQEVQLSTNDGSLSVSGQLIEFADQKYTIETSVGTMTFDSGNVLCSGEACPATNAPGSESDAPRSEFSIVGLGILASELMPEFLSSYAQSIRAQIDDNSDGNYVLTNAENKEVATISLFDALRSTSLPNLLSRQAAIALTLAPSLSEGAFEFSLEEENGESTDNDQVVGLNAITIITANDNPVNAISTSDIARVFSGEYKNWSDLGGRDAPITLYGPKPDSELANSFETQIINSQDDKSFRSSQDIFFFDNVAERVAANPDGIGYTYLANAQPAKILDIQGVCGISTPANSFNIKAEDYPLTQRLYAYRLAQTSDEYADSIMNFLQSDAGQDVLSSNGLVDQHDTSNSIENQGMRFISAIAANANSEQSELLKDMVTKISGNKRLSTTFRFETGSDQMDQRAQEDIVRLAQKLQSPENEGSVVNLIGFTDSVGNFDLNQEVSLRRANQIRDALIEIDAELAERVSILPAGFGEIAPVACNETAKGRSINRRVEVWME